MESDKSARRPPELPVTARAYLTKLLARLTFIRTSVGYSSLNALIGTEKRYSTLDNLDNSKIVPEDDDGANSASG